jgi:glycosyltransferase involved in cell wall biosynthesis
MKKILAICNESKYFMRHKVILRKIIDGGDQLTVLCGGEKIDDSETIGWNYYQAKVERFKFELFSDIIFFVKSLYLTVKTKPHSLMLITLKPAVYSGLAAMLARLVLRGPKRVMIVIPGLGRLMSPNPTLSSSSASVWRWLASATLRFLSSRRGVLFSFETEHDRAYWRRLGLVGRKNSAVMRGAGVDVSEFYPSAPGAHPGKTRILFASRLIAAKGLNLFLDAARHFHGRGQAEFLVAGWVEDDDPDRVDPALLSGMKEITFLGDVSEMADLLRSCDIVCLPTGYGEGIPRILIEAAACGLPSIVSDIPGCREIVLDGKSGTILPKGGEAELRASLIGAIERYLNDPDLMRRHGAAGEKHFLSDNFAEKRVVQRFVDLLTSD